MDTVFDRDTAINMIQKLKAALFEDLYELDYQFAEMIPSFEDYFGETTSDSREASLLSELREMRNTFQKIIDTSFLQFKNVPDCSQMDTVEKDTSIKTDLITTLEEMRDTFKKLHNTMKSELYKHEKTRYWVYDLDWKFDEAISKFKNSK